MTKLISFLLMMLVAFSATAQQKQTHNRGLTKPAAARQATGQQHFMGVSPAATLAFPLHTPDSLKCGALFYRTTDTSLYQYNCLTNKWNKLQKLIPAKKPINQPAAAKARLSSRSAPVGIQSSIAAVGTDKGLIMDEGGLKVSADEANLYTTGRNGIAFTGAAGDTLLRLSNQSTGADQPYSTLNTRLQLKQLYDINTFGSNYNLLARLNNAGGADSGAVSSVPVSAFAPSASTYTKAQVDSVAATRQSEVVINVDDYLPAAYVDSVTDVTVNINAALADCNGCILMFGKHNYIISGPLNVTHGVKIIGHGGLAPYTGTGGTSPSGVYAGGNSVIIQTSPTANAFNIAHDGFEVDGITIKNAASGIPTAGAGLYIANGNSTRIYNTFISGFYMNIQAVSFTESTIANCQFANPIVYSLNIGGVIDDEGDNNITGNWFNGPINGTAIDIHCEHPGGLRINNNKFHIAVGTNQYAAGCIQILDKANTSDLLIEGNSIEAYNTFGIQFLQDSTTRSFSNIIIKGNQMSRGALGGALHDIDIESLTPGNVSRVVISGNTLTNGGSVSSVYLSNVSKYTVNGNVFNNPANRTQFVNCTLGNFQFSGDITSDDGLFKYNSSTSQLSMGTGSTIGIGNYGVIGTTGGTTNIPALMGYNGGSLVNQLAVSPTVGALYMDYAGALAGGRLYIRNTTSAAGIVAQFNNAGWLSLGSGSPGALFNLNAGVTTAAPSTSMGLFLRTSPATATDTTTAAGATVSAINMNSFGAGTYTPVKATAAAPITVTNLRNVTIYAPITGANVTATNKYSLDLEGATARIATLTPSQLVSTTADRALTTTTALPSGTTATTQAAGTNNTTVATMAALQTAVSSSGLASNAPVVLATVTGINTKTTGATALYTVPAGKTLIVTGVYLKCTAATAITTGAQVDIGVAAGSVYANTNIAMTTATQLYQFPVGGLMTPPTTGQVLNLNINAAATGTSQTVTAVLVGYLL